MKYLAPLPIALVAGCTGTPHVDDLQRLLARHDSATAALGEWCRLRGMADRPVIAAERIADRLPPSPETLRLLGVKPGEPIGYRHVRLSCGGVALSIAHNWYLPGRLTAEMNRTLDTTDTPFGRVAASLGYTRRRLEERRGPLPGCPADTILSHRALLELPDGRPLSVLIECYTPGNLAD